MNKPPRFPPIQTPKDHGIQTGSSVKVEKLCSRMRSSQPGPCLRAVCPGLFSKEGSGSVTAYLGPPVPGKRQYLQVDLGYSGPQWHYPEFPGGRLKAQAIREGFLKERGGVGCGEEARADTRAVGRVTTGRSEGEVSCSGHNRSVGPAPGSISKDSRLSLRTMLPRNNGQDKPGARPSQNPSQGATVT